MIGRLTLGSVAVGSLLVLAGCSGDVNPVRDLVVDAGAGPPPANTPDFVARTRPAGVDYIPVGTSAPDWPTKARSAAEVKAAEAEMDAVRATNEAAATRVGGVSEPVKPKPKPKAKPSEAKSP